MKKALVIVIISIVSLVLSNIYYYTDTYRWQINTQRDVLHKQSRIAHDQLRQYFKKTQTNILLLLSSNELDDLFANKGHSIEVQKRLELLFARYREHLNTLKVYDNEGNFFGLRRGQGKTLISSFGSSEPLDYFSPKIYINPHGSHINYVQPLYDDYQLYGYVEFDMSLPSFFNSVFYNFNLEGFHFQWVMKPNGSVVYNTLHEDVFYPDVKYVGQKLKRKSWFSKIHTIHIDDEFVKVLTVFRKLEFHGSDYYLAFSLPVHVITASIARNAFLVGMISLFVILLIVATYSWYLKRKNEEERRLKLSEEALRKVLYYLPVGVVLIDKSNRIRQVNKAALQLFAYDDEDQLLGRSATDQILFENKIRLEKTTYSASSNKYILTNRKHEESVILHEQIPFFLLRERYTIQVFVEVTSLEAERKSEEMANKAKSTFIANISHELRTPLNGIIGMTDILMTSEMVAQDKELLSVVKRSADTLLVLINDILDFSKMEAGRLEIETIPFNLRREVDDTIQAFLRRAQKKNLSLTWSNSVALPENYLGDPIRIRQIFNNILSNAIKFTEKGKVHLAIKEVRGLNGSPALSFSVKDTGIGIRQEKLKAIFNSFSQEDESTTRKYGGTGLGVTISKQLVNLLGGEIWVNSPSGLSDDPDYPGAEFVFTLPYKSATHQKSYNFNHINAFNKLRAIVITDEPLQVRTMIKNLASLRIDFKVLPPSGETIDIMRTDNKHHMVIIDHRPDFSGLEFLQLLYNYKLHKRLPMLLQSSDFESSNMALAKKLGADAYLRKPVKVSVLKDFILKYFEGIDGKQLLVPTIPIERQLKVLVAEDNLLNQRVAQNLFRKIGYEIDLANNGTEAVQKAQENQYDIVFMDVLMPEMDGIVAVQKLKKKGNNCPVIALTASIDDAEKTRVIDAGMDDFITKPTRLEDLSRMLTKWCLK